MGIWSKMRVYVPGARWAESDGTVGKEPPVNGPGQARSVSLPVEPGAGKLMVFSPDKYVDTGRIADFLVEGYVVAVNLERVSREAARRIVDFLSGAAYGRDGHIVQIGYSAYLLIPAGVHLLDCEEENDPDGFDFEAAQGF